MQPNPIKAKQARATAKMTEPDQNSARRDAGRIVGIEVGSTAVGVREGNEYELEVGNGVFIQVGAGDGVVDGSCEGEMLGGE